MTRDFIYILLFLLIVDISIALSLSPFRQILPFIFFSFIPGFLILKALKLKTELSQFIVFSVAMSVAFLYLIGLFVNSLFLVKPLSYPFLIISNIMIIILTFLLREEKLLNFRITIYSSAAKIYLLGLILPLGVIIGSYLLNKFNDNSLIIFSIIYALIYIIIVLQVKDKNLSYAFVIWTLSLSLIFLVSLRTDYLISGDTIVEYNLFKASASSFKWSLTPPPYSLRPSYNACLSITILPTLYYFMTDLNGFYIFKLFLISLISFIPVAIYRLNTLFLSKEKAFLSTLLFISYYQFLYSISNLRTLIATLYFVLLILLMFDDTIPKIKRSILSLIFAVSMVLSHYSTTYVAFLFILISFVILLALKAYKKAEDSNKRFTVTFTLFLFVILFSWYGLINFYSSTFNDFLFFLKNTLLSLTEALKFDMYHSSGQRIFGVGLKWPLEYINMFIYYITMFTIFIGFLSELIKFRSNRSIFKRDYFVFIMLSMAILASTILLPYISKGYGPERVLLFCLVTSSPCFVMGIDKISRFLRFVSGDKIRFNVKYTSIVVIFLFLFANIGVIYQVYGDHHSMIFNNDGFQYETLALHKEELYGALWLNKTKYAFKSVSGDRYTSERLTGFGLHLERVSIIDFSDGSYIFLRKGIIDTKKFYTGDFEYKLWDKSFLGKKKRVYDNGGSQILI